MRFLKLTLAYEGTGYGGWQRQANSISVQSVVETALCRVTGEVTKAAASGRTDAGVHAQGQVVSCATNSQLSTDVLRRALNACLPDDICVRHVEEAPPGFHAIRDAKSKRYQYRIHCGPLRDVFTRNLVWQVWYELDVPAMREAAAYLPGQHDFISFQTSGSKRITTVRTITELVLDHEPTADGSHIWLDIEADGFLYNMVRNIVGTLVEVGRKKYPPSWVAEVLSARDRRRAGPTAPPQGLTLMSVRY